MQCLQEKDVHRWSFATKYCVAFAAAAVAEVGTSQIELIIHNFYSLSNLFVLWIMAHALTAHLE